MDWGGERHKRQHASPLIRILILQHKLEVFFFKMIFSVIVYYKLTWGLYTMKSSILSLTFEQSQCLERRTSQKEPSFFWQSYLESVPRSWENCMQFHELTKTVFTSINQWYYEGILELQETTSFTNNNFVNYQTTPMEEQRNPHYSTKSSCICTIGQNYHVLFTKNNIWCNFTPHRIINYFGIIQIEKLQRFRCALKTNVKK